MPLPSHKSPTNPQRIARAPYNFVPLPENLVKSTDSPKDLPGHNEYKGHSGYFDVALTTKSPLYIRGPLTRTLFERLEENKDVNGNPENDHTRYIDRIKNIPDFFHHGSPGTPIIPGSSLRGMLRALVEIISHGKVTRVTERQLIYRAVGDTTSLGAWYRQQLLGGNKAGAPTLKYDYPSFQVKGGYLCRINGDWAIHPAVADQYGNTILHVEYEVATAHGIRPNYEDQQRQHSIPVFVRPQPRKAESRGYRGNNHLVLNLAVVSAAKDIALNTPGSTLPAGMHPAQLVVTKHMGRRHPQPGDHPKHMHCAIYEPDQTKTPILIPPRLWDVYESDRDMNRGIPTRKLRSEGEPLFYLEDSAGRLEFFGSTMMFRLPYEKTVHDRIPKQLRDPVTIDYAEALFGYLRQSRDFNEEKDAQSQTIGKPKQGAKENAYAGRVFVTDGMLASDNRPSKRFWLDQPITPKILASPKPTCFQHYLVQKFPGEKLTLSHYDSPTLDDDGNIQGAETAIRGHKLYWHHSTVDVQTILVTPDRENTTQHTRILPVNTGVRFQFRVYFENLSGIELGALCWALQPLGESSKSYCHSLGMAKSLGLGKITLKSKLSLIERNARYSSLFASDGWEDGLKGTWSLEKLSGEVDALTSKNQSMQEETPAVFVLAFERDVLNKLKASEPRLRELPRMQALLCLLEENGPGDSFVETMPIKMGQIPTYDGPIFRDRPVLPNAVDVGGSRHNVSNRNTNDRRPSNKGQAVDLGDTRRKDAEAAIRSFKGPQDMSCFDQILEKIAVLDPPDRCIYAKQLLTKIEDHKGLKKQKDKPWRQTLDALLSNCS